MIELQYDLFQEIPDEISELRQIVTEMKSSADRQRKAMFAKIGAVGKENIELIERVHRLEFELHALKMMVCNGQKD